MTAKTDIYAEVTNAIIAKLEEGTVPWVRPWNSADPGFPTNGASGRPYSGINVPWLWIQADAKGFSSSEWFTFKQAKGLGGCVRKGEKCSRVIFFKTFEKHETVTDGNGQESEKVAHIPMVRWHAVFNRDQIDGLPAQDPHPLSGLSEEERIAAAEDYLRKSGADIRHGGGRAFYRLSEDLIQLPEFDAFKSGPDYYGTALHELTHWTSAPDRCHRKLGKRFGDESYAAEELVAELGAAFLCAQLGIDGQLQHPEYISTWLRVLKDDRKAIFTASRFAREATEFLNVLTGLSVENDAQRAA